MAASAWLWNRKDDLWDVRCTHDDGQFVAQFESEERAQMFHDDYKLVGPTSMAEGMKYWERWMQENRDPNAVAEGAVKAML